VRPQDLKTLIEQAPRCCTAVLCETSVRETSLRSGRGSCGASARAAQVCSHAVRKLRVG